MVGVGCLESSAPWGITGAYCSASQAGLWWCRHAYGMCLRACDGGQAVFFRLRHHPLLHTQVAEKWGVCLLQCLNTALRFNLSLEEVAVGRRFLICCGLFVLADGHKEKEGVGCAAEGRRGIALAEVFTRRQIEGLRGVLGLLSAQPPAAWLLCPCAPALFRPGPDSSDSKTSAHPSRTLERAFVAHRTPGKLSALATRVLAPLFCWRQLCLVIFKDDPFVCHSSGTSQIRDLVRRLGV